ncbi:hypothetical protein, partial [Komagataeibacter xylinus]
LEYFYMIVSTRRFLAALSAVAVMGVAAPVMAQTAEPTTPAVSAPQHVPDAADASAPAEEAGAKKKHHGGRHHNGTHHHAAKKDAAAPAAAAPVAQ